MTDKVKNIKESKDFKLKQVKIKQDKLLKDFDSLKEVVTKLNTVIPTFATDFPKLAERQDSTALLMGQHANVIRANQVMIKEMLKQLVTQDLIKFDEEYIDELFKKEEDGLQGEVVDGKNQQEGKEEEKS